MAIHTGSATLAGTGSLGTAAKSIFAGKGTLAGIGSFISSGETTWDDIRIAFSTNPLATLSAWTDITNDCIALDIKRGRQHELDRFEAGTATIILDNSSGNYWPDNIGSTYYPDIKIGKKISLSRTYNGNTYDIFTGFIESYRPGWLNKGGKGPIMTLYCADYIRILSRSHITDGGGYSQEASGIRIGNVLDSVNWPTGLRSVDAGGSLIIASGALSNENAFGHILDVCEAGLSSFYIAPNGDVHFEDRNHRYKAPHDISQAVFSDVPDATTETLRPNAAGDETNCGLFPNTGEANYEDVDEVSADDDNTYIDNGATVGSFVRDLYNIVGSSGSGPIAKITVYVVAKATAILSAPSLKIVCKSGSTVSESAEETMATTYGEYSKIWTTNPDTGAAWEWSDIDSLQIGAAVKALAGEGATRATQVYVVVSYGAPLHYTEVEFSYDDKYLFNDIRATREGGTEQTATDATSITAHGNRSLPRSGLLLVTDAAVQLYCNFLLARYKDVATRIRSITFNPQDDPTNLWPKALSFDISTRITIRLNDASIDADYFIEGIEHNYDARKGLWSTLWTLSDAITYEGDPSTETLRPSGAGSETSITSVTGAATHWQAVDEVTADDNTSNVYLQSASYKRDLYAMEDHSVGSGDINFVTFYFRICAYPLKFVYGRSAQKSGATVTDGTSQRVVSNVWTTKSQTYTLNPATSSAYSWAEIDALEVGVSLRTLPTNYNGRCTQVWMVVNYTPFW